MKGEHLVTVSMDVSVGCSWAKIEIDVKDFMPFHHSTSIMDPDEPAEFSDADAFLVLEEKVNGIVDKSKTVRVPLPSRFMEVFDKDELLMMAEEAFDDQVREQYNYGD